MAQSCGDLHHKPAQTKPMMMTEKKKLDPKNAGKRRMDAERIKNSLERNMGGSVLKIASFH